MTASPDRDRSPHPRRVFVLGGTGTIGQACVAALVSRGHDVVCFVRPRAGIGSALAGEDTRRLLGGATVRFGDVTDHASLTKDGLAGERFDALVSCLASRTGAPKDAWAIDHRAQVDALEAARAAGVCVVSGALTPTEAFAAHRAGASFVKVFP
ncbi:MAG: NAD-dependent epimerase/dehydratase family protein, partial [Pseudomonadota bacterium]